jgi:hypothetical protein
MANAIATESRGPRCTRSEEYAVTSSIVDMETEERKFRRKSTSF